MTFLGNILASSYKYYSKQNRVNASFQAKLIVVIVCTMLTLLILLIAKEYFELDVLSFLLRYRILAILLYIAFFIVTFRYYNKERIEESLANFEMKTLQERRLWAVIAFVTSALPLPLIFLIMIMRHPL